MTEEWNQEGVAESAQIGDVAHDGRKHSPPMIAITHKEEPSLVGEQDA
jgi:hypothetical protein